MQNAFDSRIENASSFILAWKGKGVEGTYLLRVGIFISSTGPTLKLLEVQ